MCVCGKPLFYSRTAQRRSTERTLKGAQLSGLRGREIEIFAVSNGGAQDPKVLFLGPNYWLGLKEAKTCYDVSHFLVNCYSVLGIGKCLQFNDPFHIPMSNFLLFSISLNFSRATFK